MGYAYNNNFVKIAPQEEIKLRRYIKDIWQEVVEQDSRIWNGIIIDHMHANIRGVS